MEMVKVRLAERGVLDDVIGDDSFSSRFWMGRIA